MAETTLSNQALAQRAIIALRRARASRGADREQWHELAIVYADLLTKRVGLIETRRLHAEAAKLPPKQLEAEEQRMEAEAGTTAGAAAMAETVQQKNRRQTRERKARGMTSSGGRDRPRADVLAELRAYRARRHAAQAAGTPMMQGANEFFHNEDVVAAKGGSKLRTETTEEKARMLADSVKEAYSMYQAGGPDAQFYRNFALDYHRELVGLVGEQEAWRLEGQAQQASKYDTEQAKKDEQDSKPRLDFLYAYFAQHPVQATINGKSVTIDPKNIPQDELERIYRIQAHVDQVNGDEAAGDVLDDFTAGIRGPTPEQLRFANAARIAQQEQANAERAARVKRQEERERIAQQFRENQLAAQQENQRILRKQHAAQAQTKAEQAAEHEANRHEEALLNWQLRHDQQAHILTRDAIAERKRQQQRAAERAQDKQTAVQRGIAAADARRRQIATDTAARAANMLAHTQVRLEALPTPGGIGLLLLSIIFILFAIQPVNAAGNTRLQLMWMALVPWSGVQLPTNAEQPGGVGAAIAAGVGAAIHNAFPGLGAAAAVPPSSITGTGTGNQPLGTAAAGGSGPVPFLGTFPADMALDTELPYALRSQ